MLESSVNSLRELYVRPGPMSKYLTGTINSQNLAEAWEPMQRGLSSHFCQNFDTGPLSVIMLNGLLEHKHANNHTYLLDEYLNIDFIQLHVWYKRGPWRGEAACPVHVARAGAGRG